MQFENHLPTMPLSNKQISRGPSLHDRDRWYTADAPDTPAPTTSTSQVDGGGGAMTMERPRSLSKFCCCSTELDQSESTEQCMIRAQHKRLLQSLLQRQLTNVVFASHVCITYFLMVQGMFYCTADAYYGQNLRRYCRMVYLVMVYLSFMFAVYRVSGVLYRMRRRGQLH